MRKLILFLCLALIPLTAEGAQQPRPYSGNGVIIIRPFGPELSVDSELITFYRDPGVERISERTVREIPLLSSVLTIPAGEYPLAVMIKKGDWLRIAYDDAGREGWVKMSRWWEYIPWEVYLRGHVAQLLPGLKKGSCALRASPSTAEQPTRVLSEQVNLKMIEVKGDWVLVITDSGPNGWLPWRDGDGRFLISIGGEINLQKH
jgi:hypothetical protein